MYCSNHLAEFSGWSHIKGWSYANCNNKSVCFENVIVYNISFSRLEVFRVLGGWIIMASASSNFPPEFLILQFNQVFLEVNDFSVFPWTVLDFCSLHLLSGWSEEQIDNESYSHKNMGQKDRDTYNLTGLVILNHSLLYLRVVMIFNKQTWVVAYQSKAFKDLRSFQQLRKNSSTMWWLILNVNLIVAEIDQMADLQVSLY